MKFKQHPERRMSHIVSLPFIYIMFIPILLLDITMEIYHRITFPLYGLNYVDRSKFIQLDRHKLSYLTLIQKINCAYCGYANGLAAYFVAVAGETEKYWCGIKHEHIKRPHHKEFLDYGDKKSYKEFIRRK